MNINVTQEDIDKANYLLNMGGGRSHNCPVALAVSRILGVDEVHVSIGWATENEGGKWGVWLDKNSSKMSFPLPIEAVKVISTFDSSYPLNAQPTSFEVDYEPSQQLVLA